MPGGKKAPANAIERRKREVCTASGGVLRVLMLLQAAVNAIIDTLPIEYRGSDPVRLGHLSSFVVTDQLRTDRKTNDGTRPRTSDG